MPCPPSAGDRSQPAEGRHDICQIVYTTAVSGARILRRKHVNRDLSQFSTKARKCFKIDLMGSYRNETGKL